MLVLTFDQLRLRSPHPQDRNSIVSSLQADSYLSMTEKDALIDQTNMRTYSF